MLGAFPSSSSTKLCTERISNVGVGHCTSVYSDFQGISYWPRCCEQHLPPPHRHTHTHTHTYIHTYRHTHTAELTGISSLISSVSSQYNTCFSSRPVRRQSPVHASPCERDLWTSGWGYVWMSNTQKLLSKQKYYHIIVFRALKMNCVNTVTVRQ